MSTLKSPVRKLLGEYLYFSKATICIQGLVFSHSFVNHSIISILITYLQYNWFHPHFQKAAAVTNMQEGLSDILVIVLAHFSHTYIGVFKIIATTNAAYILGMCLLWLPNKYMSEDYATLARIFYVAMVLLALGESGRSAALNEFLDKQYSSEQKERECRDEKRVEESKDEKRVVERSEDAKRVEGSEDEKRVQGLQDVRQMEISKTRKEALWGVPWFLGAVLPPFLSKTTWTQIFMISTLALAVSYLLFWFGFNYYFINHKGDDPPVVEEEITYQVEEAQAKEEVTERDNFWTLMIKLKKKGYLKEILATWLVFLVYSVVKAAGSTFFFEQMSNLKNPIHNYDPAVYFNLLGSFSKYIISYICRKLIPEQSKSCAIRVRIGCGMACATLCCVAAWVVEIHRMRKVESAGLEDNTSGTISMSMFWLIPQFCLLGFMEGLAVDGLIDLFINRVGQEDNVIASYYGSHTSDFVVGIGKLMTALSILGYRRSWLNDSINRSRLVKYYRAWTFLSCVGLCYYVCVALYFYDTDVSQNLAEEESQQNPLNG